MLWCYWTRLLRKNQDIFFPNQDSTKLVRASHCLENVLSALTGRQFTVYLPGPHPLPGSWIPRPLGTAFSSLILATEWHWALPFIIVSFPIDVSFWIEEVQVLPPPPLLHAKWSYKNWISHENIPGSVKIKAELRPRHYCSIWYKDEACKRPDNRQEDVGPPISSNAALADSKNAFRGMERKWGWYWHPAPRSGSGKILRFHTYVSGLHLSMHRR